MDDFLDGMAMRLEHRILMNQWGRDALKQTQPILTEDEWDQIQNTLSETMEFGLCVRFVIFSECGNVILEGVPTVSNEKLMVTLTMVKNRSPLIS